MSEMGMYLNGILLPRPAVGGFRRIDKDNGTDIQTLGNSIYTDFTNISRGWEISYENMLYADYETIRNIYYQQVNTSTYPWFTFNAYNIYAKVRMIISEADLAYNGVIVPTFSFTLREAFAVS